MWTKLKVWTLKPKINISTKVDNGVWNKMLFIDNWGLTIFFRFIHKIAHMALLDYILGWSNYIIKLKKYIN